MCIGNVTDHLSVRWDRSPELTIGSSQYNGCIVGELYGGKPLFPGTSALDQMEMVAALADPPSASDIRSMKSEFPETMIASLTASQPSIFFKQKLLIADATAIHSMEKFFVFNPDSRMRVEPALEHPFLAQFDKPAAEIASDWPINIILNDDMRYTIYDSRSKIYRNQRDGYSLVKSMRHASICTARPPGKADCPRINTMISRHNEYPESDDPYTPSPLLTFRKDIE
jgi:mitogen-activated protein kinase 15